MHENIENYVHTFVGKENITCIQDLITYNLDIGKFARDIIASCEGADLLLAFYECIEATTVLDPTCGAGAFLFAALRILYPLYEACLIRMCTLVNEYDQLYDYAEPQEHGQAYQIERVRNIAVSQPLAKRTEKPQLVVLDGATKAGIDVVQLVDPARRLQPFQSESLRKI